MNEASKPTNEIIPIGSQKTTNVVLDDELLRMGNLGAENVKAKDILIPRLTILQALSPQLNKKKAEYLVNAEIGDFCNVATGDIYKESVLVIPCHFAINYVEWVKNRGGLATVHGDNPDILKQCIRNEKNQFHLPNGNTIEETAQWYCLLQDGLSWTRIFFPLKATNLKHSRRWMTLVRSENIQTSTGLWKPPLFWRSWKLIIVDDSNDQGDWATFRQEKGDTTLELDESRQLLHMCMSFYEDVKGNVVRGEIVEDDDRTINGIVSRNLDDKDTPF